MKPQQCHSAKKKLTFFLKSENATKFENLTAFKQYIECYCGIKESAVEKGLGSFTLKLARHTKSAGVSTETFSINTQQQWQNERTMLQQQYNTSSLLGNSLYL